MAEHRIIHNILDPQWPYRCSCGWKASGGLPHEVQQWHAEDTSEADRG